MAKIIRERQRVVKENFELLFQRKGDYAGNGYAFPCDRQGNVKFDPEYRDIQQQSWNHVMNSDEYEGPIFNTWYSRYTENAVALCECGKEIELYDEYMGACECEHCGRWHNLSGQLLNNPETWAEGSDW